MGNRLRAVFGQRLLGPVDPPIGRIQNLFIKQLILKIENEASPVKAKEILSNVSDSILQESRFKSVRISLDVDPM
jgi:primosomal protein N' (replication factor Y)